MGRRAMDQTYLSIAGSIGHPRPSQTIPDPAPAGRFEGGGRGWMGLSPNRCTRRSAGWTDQRKDWQRTATLLWPASGQPGARRPPGEKKCV